MGQRLFSHTDNLSKTLQQTRMSAISGKRVTHLTKEVLQKMRSDASFKSFYDAVILKSKNYFSMTGPVLPVENTRAARRIEICQHWRTSISCDDSRLLQADIL